MAITQCHLRSKRFVDPGKQLQHSFSETQSNDVSGTLYIRNLEIQIVRSGLHTGDDPRFGVHQGSIPIKYQQFWISTHHRYCTGVPALTPLQLS